MLEKILRMRRAIYVVGVVLHLMISKLQFVSSFSLISSGSTSKHKINRLKNVMELKENKSRDEDFISITKSRREMIMFGLTTAWCAAAHKVDAVEDLQPGETLVYTTKSGLKYLELKEGSGRQPVYGNLVTFSYKAFIKVAGKNTKPELFDEDRAYLTKHGNGRIIPGLDEGLHTLKVGGKRRLIIPPKLGYITSGLGPLPSGFLARRKLNSLIDQMIEKQGGQVIFEIEMLGVVEDEADQGYYYDKALTPEEFATLRANIQKAGAEIRAQKLLGN